MLVKYRTITKQRFFNVLAKKIHWNSFFINSLIDMIIKPSKK
jgi:hypothetical protein